MNKVFIYWDNSNIFHEAQRLAEELEDGPGARWRVRIDFDNMLRLAHADRAMEKAFAAGSVPQRCGSCGIGWRAMASKSSCLTAEALVATNRKCRTGYCS